MVWKIILIFLCAMALVGMIGKILFPDARMLRGRPAKAAKCGHCGRPLLGRSPCDCRKGKK
ncbi:hypothetical protein [Rhodobacter sp. 24-YEA-8]|uniref:hypothetical protein n=1 Tax=Rhodobacter sp. 24-YEA-8 TaxID=1884310 RepID=UPI000B8621B4|nr:hypothetical protein [Rhodobacter sp. 24-YEA-8]